MEEKNKNGLIYGLNDRPPLREAFFAALQHLLAIFVAIITPPLIISGALKLDTETTVNPEKPDVPLNKNDAFQKVQKRHVQEKR